MCGLFRLYGLKPGYKYVNNDDSQENEGKNEKKNEKKKNGEMYDVNKTQQRTSKLQSNVICTYP